MRLKTISWSTMTNLSTESGVSDPYLADEEVLVRRLELHVGAGVYIVYTQPLCGGELHPGLYWVRMGGGEP